MNIQVYSQPDKITLHDLQAHVFTKQERLKRSLIRFFSFIALAVASILIPVFHFVLVPLFALLAPFLARMTYKEEVTISACELPCPECKNTVTFAKNSGQWPLHNNCPQCRHRIYFNTVI